jgi:3-oxoacyl-[acyl-carrier-protein] synthase II
MFIRASSMISFQPTFRNPGFSGGLSPLGKQSSLITPSYENIPLLDRRRMSTVLKMGITCSMDCLEQAPFQDPDAIIVGTSMGCRTQTRNFFDNVLEAKDGPISPTPFIFSTHNSVAAQVSMRLQNYSYNMTHTHGTLSFEHALLDSILGLSEGFKNVLVGGADELEPTLYNMPARVGRDDLTVAIGAGFFLLSAGSAEGRPTLVDVACNGLIDSVAELIAEFVKKNSLSFEEIDLVLYAGGKQTHKDLSLLFHVGKLVDYEAFSGTWFTNSCFGLAFAVDVLTVEDHPVYGNCRNILICNNVLSENLGLVLLTRS